MARRQQLEALVQSAEDGDSLASAALTDLAEEDGLPSFWTPKRGDWVFIFTGQYFHCGQLLGLDHECYCLAPGSVTVYDTGPLERLYKEGVAKECETCLPVSIVRKGPSGQIVQWPFNRVVRKGA
jgi:hypothetical protein